MPRPRAALVTAEFAKLFSTRLCWWLLLASLGLTAVWVSLTIAFSDDPANTMTLPLTDPAGQRMVLALAASASVPLVAVLGAIGLTGEFRHRTITTTLSTTPLRWRVVLAKLVAYGLVGVGIGVACLAVALGIAMPWLAARGIELSVTGTGIPQTMLGVVAADGLFALIGVGLGALLRDQVATVVGLLIYLFVAEPILTRVPALESWTVFLPGAANNALTQLRLETDMLLEPGHGGLVLGGYAVLLAVVGAWWTTRRDVT